MTMVYYLIISNEQSIPSGQTHSGVQGVINAAIDSFVSVNSETLNPLTVPVRETQYQRGYAHSGSLLIKEISVYNYGNTSDGPL